MTHPLTAYRERKNLSRADLARELEVSRTTITRWENGKQQIASVLVPAVAQKTGIPARTLRSDWAALLEGAA